MGSYFNLDVDESFAGEWGAYLGDIDPKYHVVLTTAMSGLCNWYGDKAYKNIDEWFTILYGQILELEDVLQCKRKHEPMRINVDDIVAKSNEWIDPHKDCLSGYMDVRTDKCSGMVCSRCDKCTGNGSQGHWWKYCKVTKSFRDFHFCCPGRCELNND